MPDEITYDDRGEVTVPFTTTNAPAAPAFDWNAYRKQQEEIANIGRINAQNEQDSAYLKQLVQNKNLKEAEKAVEFALQFQGMRGFERDLQTAKAAGISDEQAATQALIRNASKMFYKHPQNIAPALRMLQAPKVVQGTGGVPTYVQAGGRPYWPPASLMPGETQPSVVTDPISQERIGVRVPTGPRTSTLVRDTRPGSLTDVERQTLKTLESERKEINAVLPSSPPGAFSPAKRADYASKTNRLAEIKAAENAILQKTPQIQAVEESFDSEQSARNAGKKSGDIIRLKGVGKVRLK